MLCGGWFERRGQLGSAGIMVSTGSERLPITRRPFRCGPTNLSGTTTSAHHYPVLDNLTWPGRIPFLALTSGTTQGATKYIPISTEMVASNRKAAQTMVAFHMVARPDSRLFHGRLFFLGGTANLEQPAAGVHQGDLSGIAALELSPLLRPYTFPPLELALESNWDTKLALLAQRSIREPITLVSGVPSWLLMLFQRVLELTGESSDRRGLARALKWLFTGESSSTRTRRHSMRSWDGRTSASRRPILAPRASSPLATRKRGSCGCSLDHGLFYEFVPVAELDSPNPTRHWLGTLERGVNYAIVVSTCPGCGGMSSAIRCGSSRLTRRCSRFTGRTRYTLSAFGEHLISEEVEAAMTAASSASRASVRDWHVGPVFDGGAGVSPVRARVPRPAARPRPIPPAAG